MPQNNRNVKKIRMKVSEQIREARKTGQDEQPPALFYTVRDPPSVVN